MKKTLHNLSYFLPAVLIVAAIIGLAACSPGYGTNPSPTTNPPATTGNLVTLSNFAFSPANLTVKAGTTVTWTNKDSVPHTVTSDSNVFNSDNLAPNATYSYTFSTAGTFAYHCAIHPSMKGTVVVQ